MNKNDLIDALRGFGLTQGDTILLHSSMISLGYVEGGPKTVIDAFLEVVGQTGTLMVPIFGALGILTDEVKNRPQAVISSCSKGTVAAIGAQAEWLCAEHGCGKSVHGDPSPYTKLAELDGTVCLLGVDQDRNTTLHAVEALLELPYLSAVTGTYTDAKGQTQEKVWQHYPGPHRDFISFEQHLRAENAITVQRLGNAEVRLIKAKKLFDIGQRLGKQNPAFALCDNPACDDCVKQRAAITLARFQRESFRLTTSTRLAGTYLPEIIDNVRNAGLAAVELDYLEGKACIWMSASKLTAAVAELAANGIEVSALRIPHLPESPEQFIQLAAEAGLGRVVMPLCATSAEAVMAAQQYNIRLAFANFGQPGKMAAKEFAAVKSALCGFNFSATAFVKAGEMPFLQSYRLGRFIKTIEQLDIADMTRTEVPARLARGNAEIKELISILRCHHFSGWFCLGGSAFYPGSLKEAVADLINLLDTM